MKFKKLLSLLMTAVMMITLLPTSAFAAADPELTKTAEWVDQEAGLAKITLTTQGTPINITTGADVVMVLDASGSMDEDLTVQREAWATWSRTNVRYDYNDDTYYGTFVLYTATGHESEPFEAETNRWGNLTGYGQMTFYSMFYNTFCEYGACGTTRWDVATDAVEALSDEVIPDTNSKNRLGLVVFSSNTYDDRNRVTGDYPANTLTCGLTNDADAISATVPETPGGGTNYTTALQRAYNMLNARPDKTRPGYVVFLTDGAPGKKGDSGTDANWNGINQIAALKSAGITIYTVGFNLPEGDATTRLSNYATSTSDYHNITDADELSGLLSDIGLSITANASIYDTIDTRYFTLANAPGTSISYTVTAGTVQITGDKNFVWSLPNFSTTGETMEIYLQLKSQYLNTNANYPTNEVGSAYGTYKNSSGNTTNLSVTENDDSSAVPTLNVARNVAVNFHFVGPNQNKASFDVPAQENQVVTVGSTVTSPSVTVAPGYQITDWYETASCTGVPFNFSTPVAGTNAITLHARVDEDRSATYAYQVVFYKNGVQSEIKAGNVWAGDPTVTVGDAKALKTGNYSNYSFTEATVGAQHYTLDADEITIAANGSTTIGVYYTAGAVDLTFKRGEHGKFNAVAEQNEVSVTRSTHFDASFTDAPGIDTDLGWQQVGWYEEGDAGQNIVSFPQTVTGAKTYVMKYEKQAADWKSVTFNLNDGTTTPYRVVNDILVGNTISNSEWPEKPDKNGYEFLGWFTQDGTNDNWGTQFEQDSPVNADATVYAKWRKTKTDVPVHYYLGSVSGTELTFSQAQKISDANIGSSFTDYINDAWKEKGTEATNQSPYYNISKENAIVLINGTALGDQTVADGDTIQVVYPAKMGSFQVRDYFPDSTPAYGQYISEYEASLAHGSSLKYGASQTDLTLTAVNNILSDRLDAARVNTPGAKLKSVSIEYEDFNASGAREWQTPVTATLNAAGTAVTSFTGLDQLTIHGGCETRLVFEYEFPITVQVEYHKQYGDTDNYYKIDGASYVIGGGTSYVFKNDTLNIVENASSLNNINKVVPVGAEGYTVARVATAAAPSASITANQYQVAEPTTFIVYLDAITADGGKIVNVDNNGDPLEGAAFTFNNTALSADMLHNNEYSISQDFVYGVEYTVTQTASTPGYTKVADFKVKLKADGTGLELVGTVENVTVDDMTITVANVIDVNQTFGYTVNRYIKDTTTPVPGLPALTGEAPLGTFTWTNATVTTTGYKLVTNPVQPESVGITADAALNTENVYYEVDDTQTRNYKISYWIEGEAAPISSLDNLTVLEADPMVAYGDIPMDTIPVGYKLKNVEFAGNEVSSTESVVITSLDNEIKVIYQKDADMWVTVTFAAGDHGTWVDGTIDDVVIDAVKGTAWSNYSSQAPETPVQSEIGWKLANEAQVWNQAILGANDLIPNTNSVYTAQWIADNADVSFEIVGDLHGAVEPSNVAVQKGKTTTAPVVSAEKGYEVDGWYTDEDCTIPFDFSNTITGDTVLYAKVVVKEADWTTITFAAGDHGKWSDNTTADVVINAIKGAEWSDYSGQVPAVPVQSEIGWKLADGTWSPALPSASDVIPDAGLVYTAQWIADNADVSFEIVGDLHGAVEPSNVAVQKGKTTTAPDVSADKGYEVDGWYTDEDCTIPFDFSNTITGDTVLYAKVVVKEADWTTITFATGDHGKWSDNTTADVVINAIKGAEWSDYSGQVPAAPVQSEIGWKLADGTWSPALPSASDVIPDAGLVYTAQWIADNADVSFEIVGDLHGAVEPSNVAVQKGTTTTAPVVSANKGYEVDGWYTDEDCTIPFDFSNTITQDTVLYAKVVVKEADWTTITFKAGDHGKWSDNTTEDVVIDAIKGATWSDYSSQVPVVPVQSEIGWKLADGTWSPALPSASDVIPDAGLVYTAQWIADNADVSFEIVGDLHGAVEPSNVAVQKGTTTTAPVVSAEKGYEVDGWYTDEDCSIPFDFSTTITGDTVLYAKVVVKEADWTTITFAAGDHGKWSDNTTADVVINAIKGATWSDYSSQVPANPVQNEIGWKLADGTWSPALPSASETIPDAGLVYTAQWVADNADVSFAIVGEPHGAVAPSNVTVQKGKTTTAPVVTADQGYKVDGWYTDQECETPFDFSEPITEGINLFAKVVVKEEDWAVVTFIADANGTLNAGSGNVSSVMTAPILKNTTLNSAVPTTTGNAGYEFDAWYKVVGETETQETPEQGITVVNGDMTYLAKFSALLNVNFVINTTKAADGTTSPVTISGISKGTLWTAIESQVPQVVGRVRQNEYSHDYEFTGWNAEFPETVTSNLTYTAEFDDIYTFVVEQADLNGGAYPEESINYYKKEAGEAINSVANAPVRGYELTNITVYVGEEKQEVATTAELIETLRNNYNITLTEDGTLSGTMPEDCIWIKYGYEKKAERTVEYATDGNVTGMPENITDRYEGDTISISDAIPQRDGYDFVEWEVVDNVVEITDGVFTMPDSDVVLKAVWEPNEEVWNYNVLHYLEGQEAPFKVEQGSVLKRDPEIQSVVLNAPQGYKFKEYQINGDPTELPIPIEGDGNNLMVVYEKNDLVVKHVYGDNTVYDTTQSKADAGDGSVVVNAVNSGRYTRLTSVTVNGVTVPASRSITLDFANTEKYEVVFVYGRKSSNDSGTTTNNNNSDDFGEEVTIIDEEVPLADGLNMIDHFAYIFGYKDGTVRPTNRISREEVAAIFYRLLNDDTRAGMLSTSQSFPDVSGQRWSNKSIATLTNGEILSGYPNGEFKPGNAITRAEFAVIVSKFDNLSKADTNQFTDIENHWAKDFINSAALKGWISGYPDGTFHPDEYITRAEAMTLINSVLNRKVSKEGLLENAKYWSDNSEDAWYYEAVMEATNSHEYTRETADGAETWTAITADKTWD